MNETPLPTKCPRCGCPEKNISETHWLCGTHIATAGRPIYACYDAQIQRLERELSAEKDHNETLQVMIGDTERSLSAATADCAAKEAALKEIRGMKLSTYGTHWSNEEALNPDAVFDICDAALSSLAGQELLKELADLKKENQRMCLEVLDISSQSEDNYATVLKQSAHITELEAKLIEKTTEAAQWNLELFRVQRERDSQAERIAELEGALKWASEEARGRLPDWFHDVIKSEPATAQDAESLAQVFHETYERRAGEFSYKTREASAVPWADVPENNKRLMVAVCGEILARKALAAKGGETV